MTLPLLTRFTVSTAGYLHRPLESSRKRPQACTESAFYARAAAAPGAAFCFPGNQSHRCARRVAERARTEGADAQWYLLALNGETVELYLLGSSCCPRTNGAFRRDACRRTLAAVPDGSFFAFESDAAPYSALDPLSLISASSAAVCTGLGTNPCDARFISALATQIGINPYGDARFVGNDGTTSFTETGLHLRVSAQGRIDLQILQSDDRFQSASADALGRIEAARSLLSRLTGDSYGEARVYLQSYSEDGQSAVMYLRLLSVRRRDCAAAAAESRFASTARQITRASRF